MHHTHTHTCTHWRTHTHTHNQRSLTASVPSKCTCSTWCHFLKNESCWLTLNEFYFHVSRRDKYIRVIRPSTKQQAAAPTCSEKPQGRTVQMLLAKLFFKGEKYFFPTSKTILKTALKQKLTPVKIQNQLSIICNIRLAVEFFCCSLFFKKNKTKNRVMLNICDGLVLKSGEHSAHEASSRPRSCCYSWRAKKTATKTWLNPSKTPFSWNVFGFLFFFWTCFVRVAVNF